MIAVLAPWLMVSSLRFNLSNTSYRNLRFAFAGTLLDGVLALWPLILVAALTVAYPPIFDPADFDRFEWQIILPSLALVALYPYLHGSFRLLLLNHSRFGSAPIACTTRIKTFYAIHFRGLLVGIGVMAIGGIASAMLFGLMFVSSKADLGAHVKWLTVLSALLLSLPTAFATLFWYAFTRTRFINATFNLTTVSPKVRVCSQIKAIPMAKLYAFNTLGILFSLGLLIPWAVVRTVKQRVETTALVMKGDLDDIIADALVPASAAADAASDFFSLDVAL